MNCDLNFVLWDEEHNSLVVVDTCAQCMRFGDYRLFFSGNKIVDNQIPKDTFLKFCESLYDTNNISFTIDVDFWDDLLK